MSPQRREGPRWSDGGAPSKINLAVADESILGDLDAWAEHLNGAFAVLVETPAGNVRRRVFLSLSAAEKTVQRAQDRGLAAELALVRLVPVFRVPGSSGAHAAGVVVA